MVVRVCVHGHVPGFTAPGSPRVCGGLVALSPTRGSLRRPDGSAIVPPGKALQDLLRLVVDTPPPPAPQSGVCNVVWLVIAAAGHVGFSLPGGGGGGSIEPPKTGGGGSGKGLN